MTVSVGIAVAKAASGTDPSVVVEAADRALYRAKARGRDRICVATEQAAFAGDLESSPDGDTTA